MSISTSVNFIKKNYKVFDDLYIITRTSTKIPGIKYYLQYANRALSF